MVAGKRIGSGTRPISARSIKVFLILAAVFTPAVAQAGLISSIYLANGSLVREISDGGLVNTFSVSGEYAVAVNSTITFPGRLSGIGNEYSLTGSPTGNTFAASGLNLLDGATDGNAFYSVVFGGGEVRKYDSNWENGTTLFSLHFRSLGITYDPTDDTLWIGNYETGTIANYTMAGMIKSAFTVNELFATRGLALEYASDTLWVSVGNTLRQYSKSGVLLDSFGESFAQGAEFQFVASSVPAPGGLALLGIGLFGLGMRLRKT